MKIAIVTPTFPPYAGGIGNVAAFNAGELVKLGHQVTIFTPKYEEAKEELTELDIKRISPWFKYGNAAFVPSLARLLRGYDIVHLHYPFFGGAESIWLRSHGLKKRGAKIVLHYHMDVIGQSWLKWIFKLHRILVLPRIVKMADKIIFTSLDYGQTSDLAKWYKKNPAKFLEVPNGVDTKRFLPQPKDQALLAKHQINPDERVVMFVGGLDQAHYFKGIEYLIEAVSILRNADYPWKLVIVGEGDLKPQYQNLVGQLKLEFRVVFTGYVPNDDLPKYYNLADLVVLPSVDRSEAFGLCLVEAMSCGKPVVASDLAGVRSVVINEMNGLLAKPKDANNLASRINFFLANPALAQEYGRQGVNQTKLKYDWPIVAQKLDRLYLELKS
ncbi:MAG: glycosyltransferase family 4 protein [Patescibacteria group bacterium]|jgi:glycosyltransferase involved in cell wall biosynthesis|nr:glycosyltransferase family 4 protein [Patescibacteria group bacterium]